MLTISKLLGLLVLIPFEVQALWPIPRTFHNGTATLQLSPTFAISTTIQSPPQDLLDAISRSKGRLFSDKLGRLVVGRGTSDLAVLNNHGTQNLSSLVLALTQGAPAAQSISKESAKPIGTREEGYELTIPKDGSPAELKANSTLGLLRGLTTFEQFWYYTAGTTYMIQAPVSIVDEPAFPYRGFMLDTARNFFPVSDIERTLDAMSWVKLNTFHWHITDTQSFPLVVEGFTELAEGAYSPEETYSPSDVANIVAYAGARGIDVLMEIDTPGHTGSIAASHPSYIACNTASPWSTYANEPPSGQLRLASPEVLNFTASFLSTLAATLPGSAFSTGGDEVNIPCYKQDTETQAELKKSGMTIEEAIDSFVGKMQGAITKTGKTGVVWEEMVLDHNVTLASETIVMVWISSDNAAAVASKGFRVVHAPSNYFYLDCGAGEWIGADPTGNSWCDPFKTWSNSYTFDPLDSIPPSQAHLILGGQQLLWTEQTDPTNLDSIVWPRAAVSAEVFWTGATLPTGAPRNVSEALPRLHDLRFRMVQRGVSAIPLQPYWCALRPGLCDLTA